MFTVLGLKLTICFPTHRESTLSFLGSCCIPFCSIVPTPPACNPPKTPKNFTKIKKKEMKIFFRACWQCSPNELTYLHCVIVNPIGCERLYDAHVAVKTKQNTHTHTHTHTHVVIQQNWYHTHTGVCVYMMKALRMVIYLKI